MRSRFKKLQEGSRRSKAQACPSQLYPGGELRAWAKRQHHNIGVELWKFLHSCDIPCGLVHRQMIDAKIAQT